MTFLDAALSSFLVASAASDFASSVLPAATASLKRRTDVLSAERTDLLRSRASSFCRLRLICDLIFATRQACSFGSMWIASAHQRARRLTLSVKRPGTQICAMPLVKTSVYLAALPQVKTFAYRCRSGDGSGWDVAGNAVMTPGAVSAFGADVPARSGPRSHSGRHPAEDSGSYPRT